MAPPEVVGQWLSLSTTGHHLLVGSIINFQVDAVGNFYVRSTCHQLINQFVSADGRTFTPRTRTTMTGRRCGASDTAQDDWLVKVFTAPLTMTVTGEELVISQGSATMTFRPVSVDSSTQPARSTIANAESASLSPARAAGNWVSTSVVGHQLIEGSVIDLILNPDGTFEVHSTCNYLSSRFTATGGILTAGPNMSSTAMGCAWPGSDAPDPTSPDSRQDGWLGQVFSSPLTMKIHDGQLIIVQGDVTLTFRKVG